MSDHRDDGKFQYICMSLWKSIHAGRQVGNQYQMRLRVLDIKMEFRISDPDRGLHMNLVGVQFCLCLGIL